jgi:hypothetical protein
MISIIASSMLFGQLILNQPIVVDSQQYDNQTQPQSVEGQLIACRWFPMCADPDLYSPTPAQTKDKTTTTTDKKITKMA